MSCSRKEPSAIRRLLIISEAPLCIQTAAPASKEALQTMMSPMAFSALAVVAVVIVSLILSIGVLTRMMRVLSSASVVLLNAVAQVVPLSLDIRPSAFDIMVLDEDVFNIVR